MGVPDDRKESARLGLWINSSSKLTASKGRSARLGLWIFCAEGFHRHLFHDLRFYGPVRVIGGSLSDLVYDLHALDDLAESRISAV